MLHEKSTLKCKYSEIWYKIAESLRDTATKKLLKVKVKGIYIQHTKSRTRAWSGKDLVGSQLLFFSLKILYEVGGKYLSRKDSTFVLLNIA